MASHGRAGCIGPPRRSRLWAPRAARPRSRRPGRAVSDRRPSALSASAASTCGQCRARGSSAGLGHGPRCRWECSIISRRSPRQSEGAPLPALAITSVTIGTRACESATRLSAIAQAMPRSSAPAPGKAPEVSTKCHNWKTGSVPPAGSGQALAIALGIRHTEICASPVAVVRPLLLRNHHHRLLIEGGRPADDGVIVTEATRFTVQLEEIAEDLVDIVQRIRSVWMPASSTCSQVAAGDRPVVAHRGVNGCGAGVSAEAAARSRPATPFPRVEVRRLRKTARSSRRGSSSIG